MKGLSKPLPPIPNPNDLRHDALELTTTNSELLLDAALRPTSKISTVADEKRAHGKECLIPPSEDIALSAEHRHHAHHHQREPQNFENAPSELDSVDKYHEDVEPMLVSLRVCKQCQTNLMTAFDHCLSRHGTTANLDSIHQIDEVADAKQLTEPPYFEVIRDPTKQLNTVYDDMTHKVEKDRHVFAQTKFGAKGVDTTRIKTRTELGNPANFFVGGLYKRNLEAKDREIKLLREQLYDRTLGEKREHTNVEKLKIALNRSMRYYMYAEEWQSSESAKLQQDVRYLKAEMSSLMAFLINSEEEKRMLLDQMEALRENGRQKDAKINEVEQQKGQLKAKLHDSFKEFLVMSETITRLKREAEHGSDTIISRNEILQRNLDKLSRDFERNVQELALSQTRVKELEFELEEIVLQFNITGEAKRSAEDLNVKLTSELDAVTKEYQQLKRSYDNICQHAATVESELREASQEYAKTKSELQTKTAELANELSLISVVKKDLETSLKFAKTEIEKLSSALKSLTRSKDQLEQAFRTAVQKSDKEIVNREEKVAELVSLRGEDSKIIKKLQEQKEQLMFQVTDLQNNLDREIGNVNILTFELAQVKRTSEERTTLLEEQVEKLTAAKINLANDKRQLSDKIRLVRSELKKKEEECDDLQRNFAAHRHSSATTESTLRKELEDLNHAHTDLIREHNSLEQKQTLLIETNVELSMSQDSLRKTQAQLQQQLQLTKEENQRLSKDNQRLGSSETEAIVEKNEMKIHLDSVLLKMDEMKQMIGQERSEASVSLKEANEQIARMTTELYQLTEDGKQLDALCKLLKEAVERLELELAETKAILEAESLNKEQFEIHCYELRQALNTERRLRLELERMHGRIDKRAAERVLEKLNAMKIRDRKMNDLSKSMKIEYNRLKAISTMLPEDKDLVVIEGPDIPQFPPGGARTMSNRQEHKADIRVTATRLTAE
ncbi:hypothetical protein HK101_011235 [Irineochytrium annulatum]|nr:hypothetical protein HK101_011235 [Irineochytrium annulatum]